MPQHNTKYNPTPEPATDQQHAGENPTKHTPGPWHYQEQSDAYTHIVRGPNCEFVLSAPQGTSGECEANARLGAAAPELLAFIKREFDETVCICKFSEWTTIKCTHCEAGLLIDKAEGRHV